MLLLLLAAMFALTGPPPYAPQPPADETAVSDLPLEAHRRIKRIPKQPFPCVCTQLELENIA